MPTFSILPTMRARHAIAGVLTAALAVATAAPAAAAVTGPDVASYQHPSSGPINWAGVKASGQSFVFVKATEGSTYTNPYFAGDWAASRAAGLIHGAYVFARPSVGSAVAQAQKLVAVAGTGRAAGELPPTLDLETTGGLTPAQLVTWTQQFLATVTSLTGRTPIIYTYPYFWQRSMGNTTAFTGYPLWIASYTALSTSLVWPAWTFWQYSANSAVTGITGQVDMDQFNGTLTQLQQLANIAAVAAPRLVPAKPVVSAKLSRTSTYVGRTVTLSGTVRPFRAGQLVYRQGYYSGAWHTWATSRVSSTGSYSFSVRPTVRAVNIYRVYAPATTGLLASTSPVLRLTAG